MDTSKFLAKVIGIYETIISIAMLVNMHQFTNNISGLLNNAPLMLIVGSFTLILGVLLVVSHNIWQWNWRIIITIIAWIVLLKGASIVLYPHALDKLTILFIQNMIFAYTIASIDFILGIILIYFGFKR